MNLLKNLLILKIMLILSSCGKNGLDNFYKYDVPEKKTTDETFFPYLEYLEKDVGVVKSVVVFGNANENESWVGKCTQWSNTNYKEITIDKSYWDSASEGSRYQLLLHEIGHCEYDKGHNDNHTNECPDSVMRSYVFFNHEIDNCFNPNYENYILDLTN